MSESATEKDSSMVNAIQDQLAINQLQQLQLKGALLTVSSRTRIYLLLCLALGAALTGGVLVVLWYRSGSFGNLMPAVSVFAFFGLYRGVHNLIEARATLQQLKLLLDAQERAIVDAQDALQTDNPLLDRRKQRI